MFRKLAVEFLGTAMLVYVARGVATLMFGIKFAGASVAAGVVATALAFGLTLLALVYFISAARARGRQPAPGSADTAEYCCAPKLPISVKDDRDDR
jgi:aquaporin Z